MPLVSTAKMTADQFLQLGEDPPGVRLELVDGEIAVSPSPIPDHSYTDRMLTLLIGQYIRARKLGRLFGDVDTIFGIHDVRRPDLIYFSKSRVNFIGKKAMEGPPDLCVEIVSASSTEIDRKDKFEQYEKGRVAFYWIVDPQERSIEGFKLVGKKYRLAGKGKKNDIINLPPFDELEIPLEELWQPAR
jgi:Uma2 family endonuclease